VSEHDGGYIDYFSLLHLPHDCKQGEVRNAYKKLVRELVSEIARVEITADRRDKYLLDLATLNAAFYILRSSALRDDYVADRNKVMTLEEQWRAAMASGAGEADRFRREFDAALRHFLSRYLEELVLEAGRDPECVEASHWDAHHERHGSRVLRHFRQQLYHQIHERLPYYDVTEPVIDWAERAQTVRETLAAGA